MRELLAAFESCISGGNGELEGDKSLIRKAQSVIAELDGLPKPPALPKFTVIQYAYIEKEIEAETPEEALAIYEKMDVEGTITLDGVKVDWSLSEAMGIEVQDESGESVLGDW